MIMKKKQLMIFGLLSLSVSLFVGCTNNNETPQENSVSSNTQSMESISSSEKEDTTGDSIANTKNIPIEEAISSYQKEYPDTDITSISFDTSFDKWYYDIEGINDTTEFELRIDALTGEVSRKKEEALDKDERNTAYRESKKLDLEGIISIDEASQLALKTIGAGEVTDLDLEKELNLTYWQVTIQEGNKEHDVKIDAQTKDVLETELDD